VRRGGASLRQRRGAATHSVVSAVIEPSASGIVPVIALKFNNLQASVAPNRSSARIGGGREFSGSSSGEREDVEMRRGRASRRQRRGDAQVRQRGHRGDCVRDRAADRGVL